MKTYSASLSVESLEKRDVPTALSFQNRIAFLLEDVAMQQVFKQQPKLVTSTLATDLTNLTNDVGNLNSTAERVFVDAVKLDLDIFLQAKASPSSNLLAVNGVPNICMALLSTADTVWKTLPASKQTTVAPPASGQTQVYSDLAALGKYGGITPQQSPLMQSLIQSIPSSAWSKDPGVAAINQMVNNMLGGYH